MQRNRVPQIIKLFAERIRQARKPPHAHSHSEVLALNVAGRDMIWVRVAGNCFCLTANALTGAIAAIIGRVAVEFDKHRIVNVTTESALDGLQVGSVTVSGKLYAILQAAGKVSHKLVCRYSVTPSVMPAGNKLSVGIYRDPSPHVAVTKTTLLFKRDIFFFGVAKRPNFIALKALTRQIAQRVVLILSASFAEISKKFENGILGNLSLTAYRIDSIPFDECGHDLCSPCCVQSIHLDHILTRLSIESSQILPMLSGFLRPLRV